MTSGAGFLGWFDDDPKKSIAVKIAEGAACFAKKHGRQPNVCLAPQPRNNGASPEDIPAVVDSITVRLVGHLPPHHFLLGLESD